MRTDSNRQVDEIRRGMALHDADVARQNRQNIAQSVAFLLIAILVGGAISTLLGFGAGMIAAVLVFVAYVIQTRYYRRR